MVYIVCLDIRSGASARDRVVAAVKTLGHWAGRFPDMMLLHPHQPLSAEQIRDRLQPFLVEPDAVFVARLADNWAGHGMGSGFQDWMGRRDFGSDTEPQ